MPQATGSEFLDAMIIPLVATAPATDAADPLGSFIGHKRPRPYLEVARGGSLVRVVTHGWKSRATSSTVRGAVREFSAKSRRRAFMTFARIDKRKVMTSPLFLTLTYPASFPTDRETIKAHLAAFWKRLTRKYSGISAFWRVELQSRGAPHYHLLVFGVSFIPRTWLAQAWYEVVRSGDPRHLPAGTQVKPCVSWNLAGYYLAKYIAKVDEEAGPVDIGRHWGLLGRKHLPRDIVTYIITEPLFHEIRARLIEIITKGHPEIWLGGDYAGAWANLPGYDPPESAATPLARWVTPVVES